MQARLQPRRSGGFLSRFVSQSWEEAVTSIPAVCVAAPWFPKHWLEGPSKDRRTIVDQLRPLYPINRFAILPFPLDAEESSVWIETAKANRNTRFYVIAIDHSEPPSAIAHKFARWLKAETIDVSPEDRKARSRNGKVNVQACLNDLACYRLSSLASLEREKAMDDTGFRRSAARLSTAKRRAEKRLRTLNYI